MIRLNPLVSIYDGTQDTLTINVTATVTFPDGTTSTVSATAQVVVEKPNVTAHAFTSTGYNTFKSNPNDAGSDLGATENWSGVTIATPSPLSGGSGCFAQMVESTSETDTRYTGSAYTIQEKLSNGQWVAIPVPCLDTDFPYPYANEWTVGASGSGGIGAGEDQPYFPVLPALDPGDTGKTDWHQATGTANKFLTWIMYNPNPQGSSNIWVPLDNFDWNWSNSASLDTSLTPEAWQAGAFSGDSGSDFAPTGQWPTWNTWVPFTVINNSPTGTVAMHQ